MSRASTARNSRLLAVVTLTVAACHAGDAGRGDGAPCGNSSECRDGLTCHDARCRLPCDGDSPCGTGACVAGACSIERCNFEDDDGDGRVDEGFDWIAGKFIHIGDLRGLPTSVRAASIGQGRIALASTVAGADHRPHIEVVVIDDKGATAIGPATTVLAIGSTLPDRVVLAVDLASDEIIVGFAAGDDASCAQGCPLRIVRRRTSDLAVTADVPLTPAFSAVALLDIATDGFGLLAAVTEAAVPPYGEPGRLHVLRVPRAGSTITTDIVLDGAHSFAATLLPDPRGVAWSRLTDRGLTQVGLLDPPGAAVTVAARTVSNGTAPAAPAPHRLALPVGDGLVAVLPPSADGAVGPAVVACSWRADAHGNPSPVDLRGGTPIDVLAVGPSLVMLGAGGGTANVLARVDASLAPADGPSGPLTLGSGAYVSTLARTTDGLLVVTRLGTADPEGALAVVTVSCR